MADRYPSPISQETGSSPPSSPSHEGAAVAVSHDAAPGTAVDARASKKPKRKKPKRKAAAMAGEGVGTPSSVSGGGDDVAVETAIRNKAKKVKKKHKEKEKESKEVTSGEAMGDSRSKKPRNKKPAPKVPPSTPEGLSDQQKAANEQMRRVLEEDQYSANGSIVDTDSDSEDNLTYRGETVRMDRAALMAAMRKQLWMERLNSGTGNVVTPKAGVAGGATMMEGDDDDNDNRHGGGRKKKKKGKKSIRDSGSGMDDRMSVDEEPVETSRTADTIVNPSLGVTAADDIADDYDERDGGSIFGQTAGSSNATWVECDRCKKWRRLRGVVDEKKLPSRWYCSMNKNDPERARCSAPEEEYDTNQTPESAADARTRKHLRVWVRRLQCNEAYESRQPTLTRGRKKATGTSKEPYEWVRCCNQSCGKWRAILRIMDAKTSVIDRTCDGEWYCVMNTWDEKMASCAAPQENLPAIGCPGWVHQDEN